MKADDPMKLLIDGDGCPVVDLAIQVARPYHIQCVLICDTAHIFQRDGVEIVTVSQGADSVDFKLVNMIRPRDIVVTQDYGLAAMCLARQAIPLDQNGMIFHDGNIDGLLLARHTARKIRSSGGRLKGPPKRTSAQDGAFASALKKLLEEAAAKER